MSEESKNLVVAVRNRAIIKNPVLFEAIGIAPVVAMAVSLKSAIMLSVVASVELFLIEVIANLLFKKFKSSIRVMVYAILGVLINIPMFMLFIHFAPNETASVGIFLPLIAVNSLVALHCERVAVKSNIKETVIDAVSSNIGYVLIILIVGIVREIIGSGTIYSIDLHLPVKLSGMLMPFGGFLMLGFIAAIFKLIIAKRYPDERPEAAFNLSEISDSHIDNIRNLMAEDFNPYDEVWSSDNDVRIRLKAYSPKNEEETSAPKAEKIKSEKKKKPEKISEKKEKPHEKKQKPEKKKEKKQKAEKVKNKPSKIKQADIRPESTQEKQNIPNSTPRKREYVSEFDDLLSEIEASNIDEFNDSKDGDNK